MRGSELVDRAVSMRPGEREALVAAEIEGGTVPPFERELVALSLDHDGRHAQVWVMPDYLAIGSDDDWVRVPMTIRTAKAIARAARSVLPTKKLVDAIHAAADVRVSSPYMAPGRDMASVEYFAAHHAAIEERRKEAGAALGQLVSGPKKDLVLSKRALENPGRTAIYGWFTDECGSIQALSLLHDDRYLDYSHGVRLVLADMRVDDKSVNVLDALADRSLAPLISDEGSYDLRRVWERGW